MNPLMLVYLLYAAMVVTNARDQAKTKRAHEGNIPAGCRQNVFAPTYRLRSCPK